VTQPQIRDLLDHGRRDYRDDGLPRPVRTYLAPPQSNALRYLTNIGTATGRSAGTEVRHHDFLGENPAGRVTRDQVASDAVEFFIHWLNGAGLGRSRDRYEPSASSATPVIRCRLKVRISSRDWSYAVTKPPATRTGSTTRWLADPSAFT